MPKSEVAYRGVELVEDQDHAPLAADAPNSSCSQSHDLRLVMSEIEADLDDLEAEDVDADASKDAAAMEVDGERMERERGALVSFGSSQSPSLVPAVERHGAFYEASAS